MTPLTLVINHDQLKEYEVHFECILYDGKLLSDTVEFKCAELMLNCSKKHEVLKFSIGLNLVICNPEGSQLTTYIQEILTDLSIEYKIDY